MSDDREHDRFADIINKNAGIFGNDGAAMDHALGAFDSAPTRAVEDGVSVHMSCRGCGKPADLKIEYPEIIAVKYNVPPQLAFPQGQAAAPGQRPTVVIKRPTDWAYSPENRAWWPKIPCQRCGTVLAPMFTPDEAETHLRVARRSQWIDGNGEAYLSQIAQARAGLFHQSMARRSG